MWEKFHPHHYMTANKPIKDSLPSACIFYTFYSTINEEETLIGCAGVLFQINNTQPSKRLTRVVVLPEYQGLGFGSLIVNTLGEYYSNLGFKLYAATYHPRLGEYREKSELWEGTHYNLREFKTNDNIEDKGMTGLRDGDKMYRHAYINLPSYILKYDPVYFKDITNKLKEYEKNLTLENEKEYKILFKEYINLCEKIGLEPKKLTKVIIESLSIDSEEHKQSKLEHQKMFKRKRKPLSAEERKAAKAAKAARASRTSNILNSNKDK